MIFKPLTDGAWHHRKWVISKFNVDYQHELALCKEFLRQDQRNFHCWNYRRFVVETCGVAAEDELQYSAEKIQENFSNYSAFHHRSLFLKRSGKSVRDSLANELTIIENAIFTEPDDQSAWWYHQFLLRWALEELQQQQQAHQLESSAELTEWLATLLHQQLELVGGLYELEENCAWVITCLLNIVDTLTSPQLVGALQQEQAMTLLTQRTALLEKLLVVDPNHKQRYQYLLLHPKNI